MPDHLTTIPIEEALIRASRQGLTEDVRKIVASLGGGLSINVIAEAAAAGHADIVRLLIPFSDLSQCQPVPTAAILSPIARAAEAGHQHIVELLLAASPPAAINAALCKCATCGHKSIVDLLLSHTDPAANDSLALWHAVLAGHIDIVNTLLPVSDPWAHPRQAHRPSAIVQAINGCKTEILRIMLDARPQALPASSLDAPAGAGNLEIVQMLLPMVSADEDCTQLLFSAALGGHPGIVQLLITRSNPKQRDNSLLAEVASYGGDMAASLIAALPPTSLAPEPYQITPLWMAVTAGNIDAARVLIPVSDTQDLENGVLLFSAAHAGRLPLVEMLLTFCKNPTSLLESHGASFAPPAYAMIRSYLDAEELTQSSDPPTQMIKKPLK